MCVMNLEISKEIYDINSLQDALKAYKELATINLNDTESKWILEFRKCRYDAARTMKEFENYLIGMENR